MKSATIMAATLLLAGAPAHTADFASWQGLWRINYDRSYYPPSFPALGDHIIAVTRDDGIVLQYTETVRPGGKDFAYSFDGKWDGSFYEASNHTKLSFAHVAPNEFFDRRDFGDGVGGEDRCSFSANRKTVTCHGVNRAPGRKDVEFLEVFERVK